MASVSVTFDPDDPVDMERARRYVSLVAAEPRSSREDRSLDGAPPELTDRVSALIRGYGRGRHNYMRLIAGASPEPARYEAIKDLFMSAKAIGGTHSAIERSWRSMGASAPLIETDDFGNSQMAPEVAHIVLQELEAHGDAPDGDHGAD